MRSLDTIHVLVRNYSHWDVRDVCTSMVELYSAIHAQPSQRELEVIFEICHVAKYNANQMKPRFDMFIQ